MTCKICGKDLLGRITLDDAALSDVVEEMDKMSCDALYTELHTTPMAFRYNIAKLLLQKRGHDEVS